MMETIRTVVISDCSSALFTITHSINKACSGRKSRMFRLAAKSRMTTSVRL